MRRASAAVVAGLISVSLASGTPGIGQAQPPITFGASIAHTGANGAPAPNHRRR